MEQNTNTPQKVGFWRTFVQKNQDVIINVASTIIQAIGNSCVDVISNAVTRTTKTRQPEGYTKPSTDTTGSNMGSVKTKPDADKS